MRSKKQTGDQGYLHAEALKYKHGTVGKLTLLMPVICVMMSAFLTHVYFAVEIGRAHV